jgi:hypothetical protein
MSLEDILSVLGLLLTFAGAAKTAVSVRISPHDAGQVAANRWMSEDQKDWKDTPLGKSLLKASRGAMWGLGIIAIGTLLQVVAAFL